MLDNFYKCEECNLKSSVLYFDKITKKWFCKLHSPYLGKSNSYNSPVIAEKAPIKAHKSK